MNEKIKELMEQASYGACYDTDLLLLSGTEIEKFAELIVRECMSHAEEIGRLNHGQGSWRAVYDRIRIKMLGEEL